MQKFGVCVALTVLALLCPPNQTAPRLVRKRRGIASAVAKMGDSLMTPLITKGAKGLIGMSKDSYEAFRLAATKESTEGKWLTSSFIELLFVPTVAMLTDQLRDIHIKLQNQTKTKDDFIVVALSLAGVVPTVLFLLVLLCYVNGRRTQRIKGGLRDTNRSLELIRAATSVRRARASGRRTHSPSPASAGGAGSSSAGAGAGPTSPPVNFHIGS